MKTTTTIAVIAVTALALLSFTSAPAADKGDKKNSPEANQPNRPSPEATAPPKTGPRDPAAAPGKAARPNTKEGKMFVAYDKDQDGFVTAKEIEAMREGKRTSAERREIRKQVKTADVDKNGSLDLNEYTWWLKNREKLELDRRRGSKDTGRPSAEG